MGVCDGHGVNGHYASDFVKKVLPQNVEYCEQLYKKKQKKKETGSIFLEESRVVREKVIADGFFKTASDLKKKSFDVSYSGTTVVSCFVQGNKVICANVGDSRACLGKLRTQKKPVGKEEAFVQQGAQEGQ